jgi:ABC-2 type transport system permease protein
MGIALGQMGWVFNPVQVLVFLVMFACGTVTAYSFLLMLTSTSVWFVRNQSLLELWWLFTSLMRYPREIFVGTWAAPMGWFFTFVVPMLLVVNVPARVMVKVFDPAIVAFTVAATAASFLVSWRLFRLALRSYRSASS